jgi:hypothetical protein
MHNFKIVKTEEKMSQSQKPMWVLDMECIDQGEDKGKHVIQFVSLSVEARFKLDELLDAVLAPKAGKMDHSQLVGKELRAGIAYGEFNGRVTANVYSMLAKGSTQNPVPPKPQGPTKSSLPADSVDKPKRSPFS